MYVNLFSILVVFINLCGTTRAQSWWPPDDMDTILDKMAVPDPVNCHNLTEEELRLPSDAISHLPRYSISDEVRQENRTLLWEAFTLALIRGLTYSFVNVKLNESFDFQAQPGIMHYYMSSAADVASNEDISGSGIFYDNNFTYPNWYQSLPFNRTIALFGPRAFQDPQGNYSTFTQDHVDITDYGSGPDNNYTIDEYIHNPWYELFLPDPDTLEGLDPVRKWLYYIPIKYAESTDFENYIFLYAALPTDDTYEYEPVLFTPPYYDCGRTNEWIVSAVAPVIDYLPRYLDWFHLRRYRFIGESVVDINYSDIDINQCRLSDGNLPPNVFHNTAKCKLATTICSTISGFGLQRGGYECNCRQGFVYPPGQLGPFQGTDIENATEEEYNDGFECLSEDTYKEDHLQWESYKVPSMPEKKFVPRHRRKTATKTSAPTRQSLADVDESLTTKPGQSKQRTKFVPRYKRKPIIETPIFDMRARLVADEFMIKYHSSESSSFPEEMAYGAEEQFASQSKLVVRLAHFLSSYLQNLETETPEEDPKEDKPFHRDALIAEVLAIVMADTRVLGSGIYFDQNKYVNNEFVTYPFFGPYAHRDIVSSCKNTKEKSRTTSVRVRDRTTDSDSYIDEPWFSELKDRWTNVTSGLGDFEQRPVIRNDISGTGLKNFRRYPVHYKAASILDGIWTGPYCPCDEYVDTNILTFSVPFFGPPVSGSDLEFKGVVTVDVLADLLDINQCPQPFWVPNIFKNTAMCDYNTTMCRPVRGRGFKLGSYQCSCKTGYVSPDGYRASLTGKEVEEAFKQGQIIGCIPV